MAIFNSTNNTSNLPRLRITTMAITMARTILLTITLVLVKTHVGNKAHEDSNDSEHLWTNT